MDQWFRDGETVPLYAKRLISWTVESDLDLTQALCTLLADRPDARRHLDDTARVERLLGDMRSVRRRRVHQKTGGRRITVEVMTAMRMLGYEHDLFGRPLPDETLDDARSVAGKVLDTIRANPYAQCVEANEDELIEIVARHYTDIEPWPFAALLAP